MSKIISNLPISQIIIPIVGILILVIVVFIVMNIMKSRRSDKRIEVYGIRFTSEFQKCGDIYKTMENVKNQYPEKSQERKALEAGLMYLQMSMFKDYYTGFSYIEDLFESEEINKMHESCVDQVRQQRMMRLETNEH